MAEKTKDSGKTEKKTEEVSKVKKEVPSKKKPVVEKKDEAKKEEPKKVGEEKKELPKEEEKVGEEKKEAVKEEKKKEEKPKKEKKPSYTIVRSEEAKKLAKERSRLRKKKGKFKRQNFGKKKRVPDKWRRPDGIDSGHQKCEKSKPAIPRAGYITPKKVRGIHPSGYASMRIWNTVGLDSIDSKSQAIIIASSVGKRKRNEIQNLAKEKGIQILNFKE